MFKVGDVVRLKSGGPKMTVAQVPQDLSKDRLKCVWFDDKNDAGEAWFYAWMIIPHVPVGSDTLKTAKAYLDDGSPFVDKVTTYAEVMDKPHPTREDPRAFRDAYDAEQRAVKALSVGVWDGAVTHIREMVERLIEGTRDKA
jgi:uncharacterized protein YodC (DUF2158 family)